MAEHNARLNKLVANFGDIEARRKLIAELHILLFSYFLYLQN